MPYILCPNCGQKALKIATRCPHCGHAFEGRLWQTPARGPGRRQIAAGLMLAVALVVLMVVSVVRREQVGTAGTSPAPPPAGAPDSPPPSPPPVAAVESAESAPPIDSTPPIDSAPSTADTVTAPAPAPSGPAIVGGELRHASTWVNVREARSFTASVVRVLAPGDTIRVDSLMLGWYRVLADGRTLGYVDHNFVSPNPGPAPR